MKMYGKIGALNTRTLQITELAKAWYQLLKEVQYYSMHVYERFVSRVAPLYLIALSISDTITCRTGPPGARSPVSRSLLMQ